MHTFKIFLIELWIITSLIRIVQRMMSGDRLRGIPQSVVMVSNRVRPAVEDFAAWDQILQMEADGEINEDELLRRKAELIGNSIAVRKDAHGRRTVVLIAGLENKIKTIKEIRSACPQYRLVEVKYLVDHMPQVLCSQVTAQQAASIQCELETAGLKVRVA
jgi:ribosomal protein L7/L12